MIDIETRMITLLGTPLSQSFAARMMNKAYAEANINLCYFYSEVDNEHLCEVVNGLRYLSFAGFAVTKPNKIKVMEYLDEYDPLCKKMGSCNTVKITPDNKLIGYNTDGVGFYKTITLEAGINVEESTFFLIGAGGVGRAIASILAYHNAKKIYLTDIVPEMSEELFQSIVSNFGGAIEVVPFGDFSPVEEADVIVNGTGIGMGETIGQTPLPKEHVLPGKLYFDACYNPAETQFLINAKEAGCPIINGLSMTMYQGAAQIEIWTGKEAPVEIMRQELLDIMAEKEA